jgi:DNA gyrase/topoisomerase IV subunit B
LVTLRSLHQVKIEAADAADEILSKLMGGIVELGRGVIPHNGVTVAKLDR